VFGDVGYTVVGKVPGLDLRNRTTVGFGVGRELSEATTISGMFDWRSAIVAGNPNPAEFTGVLSYKLSPSVTLSPNGFVGLTSGSSDFRPGPPDELPLRSVLIQRAVRSIDLSASYPPPPTVRVPVGPRAHLPETSITKRLLTSAMS
jgi:hypothetical protein